MTGGLQRDEGQGSQEMEAMGRAARRTGRRKPIRMEQRWGLKTSKQKQDEPASRGGGGLGSHLLPATEPWQPAEGGTTQQRA